MSGTVLITGGSRGIGAATARLAAARGFAVAVNYRERRDAADALVAEIGAAGGSACALQGDVSDERDVERLFAALDERLDGCPLVGLVNSAGIGVAAGPVAELRAADVTRLLALNVVGTILASREAVRRMSTSRGGRGGAIVNLSSMAATIGGRPGSVAYAASKGAVDVFTVGLAKEVAAEGIRVNAVRPGFTVTDMTARVHRDPGALAAIRATIPLNRLATAEEVARPIAWLLDDDAASFVSGAVLNVSGGGFLVGAGHPAPVASTEPR